MRIFSAVMAVVFFTSCEVINPAEPVPSYLRVNSFSVYSNNETEGSSSANISDVWVSIDGEEIGTFELPATIPVLATGNHKVILRAGILANGIASLRVQYPFYSGYDSTVNFESGKIHELHPSITYASYSNFQIEDFDHSSISIDTTPASQVRLIDTTNSNNLEGNFGYVLLDDGHPYFECASLVSFSLPGGGANVYLELNYKCNNEFVVGTIANTTTSVFKNDILTIRATDVWKKIYVTLTPTVSSLLNATGWKIYMHATKSPSQTTAELYFDNIKVVY
jgi:hypothetical protein